MGTKSRKAVVGLGVVAAMLCGGCGSQTRSSTLRPLTRSTEPLSERRADALADKLQERIRRGQPVSYNANLSVEWLTYRANGKPLRESTDAPLDYMASGVRQYFRLEGYSLSKLRVRPIRGRIATAHESWHLHHRAITATSHKGVIHVSHITHIPYVNISLSNGTIEGVAIAWTSATP